MENQEKQLQKVDVFVLLGDFLRQAKRTWLLGVALILVCSLLLVFNAHRSYRPYYEAYASFTVRVANPLYGSISSYNEKTAEVMADTFPSILTSNLLQRRVMEELGISGVPTMSVTASAQSSILTLKVRDTDPQRAYDVLHAVITCYPEVSEFVVGATALVLLDESGVPQTPVNTLSYRGSAVKGAALGAAAWIALALLMSLLRNTVHNEKELRRTLNTPCLGQLPAVKLSGKVTCPLAHRLRRGVGFSESVRLLRLRVEKAMEEGGHKVLLISSAIPGEGKTTVAANLAVSLASKGKRVLLIDCDLRNPSVAKALSTKNHPVESANSLVDFLNGTITVKQALQQTELENLTVISGGSGVGAETTQLLSQNRMARLVQAAGNLYEYVILDTPPCSYLADAAEVAELAQCALLVIREDFASREQIVDGAQRLSDGKLALIGCMLNGVTRSGSGNYGYGYGYGSGYGYGKKN